MRARWPFWLALFVATTALGCTDSVAATLCGFSAAVFVGWAIMARVPRPTATVAPVVFWVSHQYDANGKEPVN